MSALEPQTPPAGEDVHLPGPSLVPVVNAVGLTLAVLGLSVGILITIAGLIIFVLSLVRWIADTRRDVAELPPEHSQQ